MAFTYGFFNSEVDSAGLYDREYAAEHFAEYFSLFIRNGVFANPTSQMQVLASSTPNMNVNVNIGYGWINGYWAKNDSLYPLAIQAASGSQNRVDAVVLRWINDERKMELAVKTGAYSSTTSPIPPTVERSSDVYELMLATVTVSSGVTTITQAQITDKRSDDKVCGFVKGLIDQINTTNLFAQYDSEFRQWFDNIQAQLSGDVATNLQNQINNKLNISAKATLAEVNSGAVVDKYVPPNILKQRFDASDYQIGDILFTTRTDLGNNWLKCDGSTFSTSTYPNLSAKLAGTIRTGGMTSRTLTAANLGNGNIYATYTYNGMQVFVGCKGFYGNGSIIISGTAATNLTIRAQTYNSTNWYECLSDVTYGNGYWVAVGYTTASNKKIGLLYYSTNGTSWTRKTYTYTANTYYLSITFYGGKFYLGLGDSNNYPCYLTFSSPLDLTENVGFARLSSNLQVNYSSTSPKILQLEHGNDNYWYFTLGGSRTDIYTSSNLSTPTESSISMIRGNNVNIGSNGLYSAANVFTINIDGNIFGIAQLYNEYNAAKTYSTTISHFSNGVTDGTIFVSGHIYAGFKNGDEIIFLGSKLIGEVFILRTNVKLSQYKIEYVSDNAIGGMNACPSIGYLSGGLFIIGSKYGNSNTDIVISYNTNNTLPYITDAYIKGK